MSKRLNPARTPGGRSHVYTLSSGEAQAARALTAALALARPLPEALLHSTNLAIDILRLTDPVADIERATSELVTLLIRSATSPQRDNELTVAVNTIRRTVADCASRLSALFPDESRAPPAVDDEETIEFLGDRLLEEGLEEHDTKMILGQGKSGRLTVVWTPLPPHEASIHLIELLFEMVEGFADADEVFSLERQASGWFFDQFSGPWPSPGEQFAARLREQEWSIVDRPRDSDGKSFLASLCTEDELDVFGERQGRLARGLLHSIPGIFMVRERTADESVLEHLASRERYRIVEHNHDVVYGPGYVSFGRIIPFEGGRWLRSPGMVFCDARHVRPAILEEVSQRVADSPTPALAVEASVTALVMRTETPRAVAPASSRAEARQLTDEIREALVRAGLARQVDASAVPPDERVERHDAEYWDYDIDDIFGAWVKALDMYAAGEG